MTTTLTMKDETGEERAERETFVRQVEDHSLPAGQVLTDQRDARLQDNLAQVFVPWGLP